MRKRTLPNYLLNGIIDLLFPNICACCSCRLAEGENRLCIFCRQERFEFAPVVYEPEDEILPELIAFRVSLWEFNEGGVLQELIHMLKYRQLYDLGIDFGLELGKIVQNRFQAGGWGWNYDPFLVPVPLFRKSERKRGYNQARAIAEGVSRRAGWGVVKKRCVVRVRQTRSQTGLNARQRKENVEGAFKIRGLKILEQEMPVIVDDVYTTGATTFELAGVLKNAGARRVAIATLAEA